MGQRCLSQDSKTSLNWKKSNDFSRDRQSAVYSRPAPTLRIHRHD